MAKKASFLSLSGSLKQLVGKKVLNVFDFYRDERTTKSFSS